MAINTGYENGSSNLNDVPLGYYYYVIPKNETHKATYLGFVDCIQNLTYNPFINMSDISNVVDAPFEKTKYGEPLGGIPKCYAIRSFDFIDKELFSLDFNLDNYNGAYDIKLESFPYKYYLLTDYVNPPLLIKPQLIDDNKIKIRVRTTPLSVQAKYSLYVDNYKGDSYGNLEGIVNSVSYMLPVSSSVYSQYMATSSASYNQNMQNLLLENDKNLHQSLSSENYNYEYNQMSNLINGVADGINSAIGAGVNIASGNIAGGIGGLVNFGRVGSNAILNADYLTGKNAMTTQHLMQNHQLTEYQVTANKNAKMRDLLNTPLSIKSAGNDTIFNMLNSNFKVDLIEYSILDKPKNRINEYFKRYGYKCNDYWSLFALMYIRPHYNYIKTSVCNIYSESVPHNYVNQIKEIFNNGITLWHMDNNTTLFDYNQDNKATI